MSVGKIILKSTTKMSLNARFTVLRQEENSFTHNESDANLEVRRLNVQASRRNQRLATQMERRPNVAAALKIEKSIYNRLNGQKTINVKQRLGLQSRLSIPGQRGTELGIRRIRGRGRGLRMNWEEKQFPGRGGNRGASFTVRRGQGRGANRGASFTVRRGQNFRQSRGRGTARGGRTSFRGSASYRGRRGTNSRGRGFRASN